MPTDDSPRNNQTWKSFLKNHAKELIAVDFFAVPTATFRVLYVFLVLAHERRRVLHFNVTDSPSSAWTAQQLTEAFPFCNPPRYLLRDRDSIYGAPFQRRAAALGLAQKLIAARSPWQNPYIERLIGSIRRECLDHVIVLHHHHHHLKRLLAEYFQYYHRHRPHRGLDQDCPQLRLVEPPEQGNIIALPLLGGLHHRYTRQAARKLERLSLACFTTDRFCGEERRLLQVIGPSSSPGSIAVMSLASSDHL